jgi:hypothetical protein
MQPQSISRRALRHAVFDLGSMKIASRISGLSLVMSAHLSLAPSDGASLPESLDGLVDEVRAGRLWISKFMTTQMHLQWDVDGRFNLPGDNYSNLRERISTTVMECPVSTCGRNHIPSRESGLTQLWHCADMVAAQDRPKTGSSCFIWSRLSYREHLRH